MKRLYKSLLALLLIATMSCTVLADETTPAPETTAAAENETTAGKEEATTGASVPTDKEQLQSVADYFVSIIKDTELREAQVLAENAYGKIESFYNSYATLIGEKGQIANTGSIKVNEADDIYTVTLPITCEKGKGQLVIVLENVYSGLLQQPVALYDANKMVNITDISFQSVNDAAKANIGKAALNTVMGMGTVVLVLVLILFIISLFKYFDGMVAAVSGIFKKKEKRKEQVEAAIDQAVARIEVAEQNCMDDLELVAVITAAIAAQTGAGTDSFVVRKIKRR